MIAKDWRHTPMIAPLIAEQERRKRAAETAEQEAFTIIRRWALEMVQRWEEMQPAIFQSNQEK